MGAATAPAEFFRYFFENTGAAAAARSGVMVLEREAFDLIVEKLGASLTARGFSPAERQQAEDGPLAVFTGGDTACGVLYRRAKKRFELLTCGVEDGKPDGRWKSLSVWLYEPEGDGSSQAEDIAADFIETVCGPRQIAAARPVRKKHRKEDSGNVDPLFFLNRFVNVFPELREEITEEKARFGAVRAVTFTRGHLVPKLERLCAAGAEKSAIDRCGKLLSEMYVSGDMDVRSLITIVVLNGLSERAVQSLKPSFSEELAKGYRAGVKMKGKKVRPEKKKKRKKIVAETLNEMEEKR